MKSSTSLLILTIGLLTTQIEAVEQTISPSCATANFREFDFWLGQWNVTTVDGKKAGDSSITLEIDGCVLHEHYHGQQSYYGESFNIYDATTKLWHQSWVDNGGTLLLLNGQLENGAMVLSGETKDATGHAILNRITWTKNNDGTVRQWWESSNDNGKTWQTLFDGRYSKKN